MRSARSHSSARPSTETAARVVGAFVLALSLALAWWGYRQPELFLDLARMPFC